jgi:serine/threonine protein kinase
MAADGEIKPYPKFDPFDMPVDNTTHHGADRMKSTETPSSGGWAFQDEPSRYQALASTDGERSRRAAYDDADAVPTPPIDVPSPREGPWGERGGLDNTPSYYEAPEPDDELRNRKPSIRFSKDAVLENGSRVDLDEPLSKLQIRIRPRGKSLLQEMARGLERSPQRKADGEAAQDDSDQTARDVPYHPHRPRYPPLQSTVDEMADSRNGLALEENPSLTSELTRSPTVEEAITPLDIPSPLFARRKTIASMWNQPTSLEESSAWPPTRKPGSSSKAKSYTCDRLSSSRPRIRRPPRHSTSTSMSPASTFLSQWGREEATPEPDDEGQEVGDYVLGKVIGFGGFSVVREAFPLSSFSRTAYAVKIVRKQVLGKEETENDSIQSEFEHEVALWRCLSHKYILPLIAVYITPHATFAFTQLTTGGTLFDQVRANRKGLSATLVRRHSFQLASAIRYLHEDVRIVHRDIKLENCLLDVSAPDAAETGGTLLLCDFGLAEYITSERWAKAELDDGSGHAIGPSATSTSIAGSLPYASPEVARGNRALLRPAGDMWAFGVVVFALIVGDLPFHHSLAQRVREMILDGSWDRDVLKGKVDAWNELRAGHDKEIAGVVELVSGCLEMDSDSRWTVGTCLDESWLGSYPRDDEEEEEEEKKRNAGWGNRN